MLANVSVGLTVNLAQNTTKRKNVRHSPSPFKADLKKAPRADRKESLNLPLCFLAVIRILPWCPAVIETDPYDRL